MNFTKHLGQLCILLSAMVALVACGGESTSPGIPGTWKLDVTELKEAARKGMEKELAGKEGAMAEMVRDKIDKMLAAMDESHLTMTFATDGNWTSESVGMNESTGKQETSTSRGTWSLDGDEVVVVTTHRNGKVVSEPETGKGSWDGDVIRIRGEGPEPDLVLRRQ